MSETAIQWIVVGVIVALCVWRAVGSVTARRKGLGCSCGSGRKNGAADESCSGRKPSGCDGCPLSDRCDK